MDENVKKALVILVKHAKPMVMEMIAEVAEPALMAVVAKSENKIDDVLAAALAPLLKQALVEMIEKIEIQ
jgi:hypothetical protein